MSFKRLDPQDFVVSSDTVTAAAWRTGAYELTTFHTSSTQAGLDQGKYALAVYNAGTVAADELEFYVQYGNKNGSGSLDFNSNVAGKSPSRTVYGQYQNVLYGEEGTDFTFGSYTADDFYVVSLERAVFKEKVFLGTFNLTLSGSDETITITDNSSVTSVTPFINGVRAYTLVSGSNGTPATTLTSDGTTPNSGSYGYLLPDYGVALLNAEALSGTAAAGGIGLSPDRTGNIANVTNTQKIFDAISGGASFKANSEETITSDFAFIRVRNNEFNYSTNPSFISSSTGELTQPTFVESPVTYMTSIGLYNDAGDLLATAALSKPLQKDFTKEALVRVKLDF